MNFEVRTNCEYSLRISAESEEAALDRAEKTPYGEWAQAWAPYDAAPVKEPR